MRRIIPLLSVAFAILTPWLFAQEPATPKTPAAADKAEPALEASEAVIAQLIRELGDDKFNTREAATKKLEKLGARCLPLLKSALKTETDPDAIQRLETLIPGIERVAAFAGTRITLSVKDKPLNDVIAEFRKQTGYQVMVNGGEFRGKGGGPGGPGGGNAAKKTVTLELNDVPFWQALDKLCDAAGLSYPEGYYSNEQGTIYLESVEANEGYLSFHGPFRVSLRSIYVNRSVEFMSGPRTHSETAARRSDSMNFSINIISEPKLPMMRLNQVVVTEAIDDMNQSMAPPKQQPNETEDDFRRKGFRGGEGPGYDGGYRTFMQQASGYLIPGSKDAKKMKSLKGTIPVTVIYAMDPLITVENLLDVEEKNFAAGDLSIAVKEAKRNGSQIMVKMTIRMNGRANPSWMNNLQQRLDVFDESGRRLPPYGANEWNQDQTGTSVNCTLSWGIENRGPGGHRLVPRLLGGQGDGGPFKMVYHDWKTTQFHIPFEFKNVPLP